MRQAPLVRASFAWEAESYKDSFSSIDKATLEKHYGADGINAYIALGTDLKILLQKKERCSLFKHLVRRQLCVQQCLKCFLMEKQMKPQ